MPLLELHFGMSQKRQLRRYAAMSMPCGQRSLLLVHQPGTSETKSRFSAKQRQRPQPTNIKLALGHFKSSISCHKSPWFDWFDWLTGSTVWTCTQLNITGSWRLSLSKTQVNSVLGRRSLLYQKLADHVSNETECRPLTMLFTRASK